MCPQELIQCEYHVMGCKDGMARKDQKKHKKKMKEHLYFTKQGLNTSQEQLKVDEATIKNSNNSFSNKCDLITVNK